MPFVEDKEFRYPAEDECLVRRLGAGVIAAWPYLPEEARARILANVTGTVDQEWLGQNEYLAAETAS